MARRDCGVRGFLVEFGSVVDAALRGRGTGPCAVALPALHTQQSHRPQTLLPKAVRERPARSRDRWRGAAAVPGDRQPRRAGARAGDLDQLEQIAFGYTSRERFLTELTLDPPDASGAEAGRPPVDEDYLILSTIHSAKGQEWDTVFILNLVDGCIPSDMATGKPEQVDEERRLLYVAMTRAREHLYLVQPRRFYRRQQHRHGRSHLPHCDRAFCQTMSVSVAGNPKNRCQTI